MDLTIDIIIENSLLLMVYMHFSLSGRPMFLEEIQDAMEQGTPLPITDVELAARYQTAMQATVSA